ncbi:MAG: hypothetical protein IPQ09_10560 [Myxococcales bacterium]|nr:hypothetical protein [Myxococcales bacterium]
MVKVALMASDERASLGSEVKAPAPTDGSAAEPDRLADVPQLDPAEARDAAASPAVPQDGTALLDETPDATAGERPSPPGPTARDGSALAPASAALPSPRTWLAAGSRPRRLLIALAIYTLCLVVFAAVAGKQRLTEHTAFNHYAHLADAWLHGRQDLRNGPPDYAQGNDFAQFQGKTYISFPPFPAVLMLPLVAVAGSPEDFRDGQFMVWLAGVGPAVLFLVLEKLRRRRISLRTEGENVALACLLAFGTVYFFTSVEGTVWFAAHVVGVGLAALYLLFALDAERPFLAGLCLACSWMTRPSTVLLGLVFLVEAIRLSSKHGLPAADPHGELSQRARLLWAGLDLRKLMTRLAPFAVPLAVVLVLSSAMNYARFGNPSPTAFGHEHLSVVWKGRIQSWGLFGYHYLPKNLGVMLTVLPWRPPGGLACFEGPQHGPFGALSAFVGGLFGARPACTPFRINEHGLALWFTTPVYFWLFRPKARSQTYTLLAVAALLPCALDLLYQNSGWRQFGYRFSNDYAVLLFVLLALGQRPMGGLFKACAVWSVAWNLFGAATFDRGEHDRFYFREGSQSVLYQAD